MAIVQYQLILIGLLIQPVSDVRLMQGTPEMAGPETRIETGLTFEQVRQLMRPGDMRYNKGTGKIVFYRKQNVCVIFYRDRVIEIGPVKDTEPLSPDVHYTYRRFPPIEPKKPDDRRRTSSIAHAASSG
jgi:hypothetical protein